MKKKKKHPAKRITENLRSLSNARDGRKFRHTIKQSEKHHMGTRRPRRHPSPMETLKEEKKHRNLCESLTRQEHLPDAPANGNWDVKSREKASDGTSIIEKEWHAKNLTPGSHRLKILRGQ